MPIIWFCIVNEVVIVVLLMSYVLLKNAVANGKRKKRQNFYIGAFSFSTFKSAKNCFCAMLPSIGNIRMVLLISLESA